MSIIGPMNIYDITTETPGEREISTFIRKKYSEELKKLVVQGKDMRLDIILNKEFESIRNIIRNSFNVALPSHNILFAKTIVEIDYSILLAIIAKEGGAISKNNPHKEQLDRWYLISNIRRNLMKKFGRYLHITDPLDINGISKEMELSTYMSFEGAGIERHEIAAANTIVALADLIIKSHGEKS